MKIIPAFFRGFMNENKVIIGDYNLIWNVELDSKNTITNKWTYCASYPITFQKHCTWLRPTSSLKYLLISEPSLALDLLEKLVACSLTLLNIKYN